MRRPVLRPLPWGPEYLGHPALLEGLVNHALPNRLLGLGYLEYLALLVDQSRLLSQDRLSRLWGLLMPQVVQG